MSGTAAFGIICKTPIVGQSKTRLHPALGAERSAELAACFLTDIASAIDAVPRATGRAGYGVYAPAGSEQALQALLPADFGLFCRRESMLGGVLLSAIEHFLGLGHDCAILVNGDSPTMPPLLLTAALAALRRPGDRVVLGPAVDGGYYLIGLKAAHAHLFHQVPWSTAGVMSATRTRAAEIGLPVEELPAWYDVDEIESLAMLFDELAGQPLAFNTAAIHGGQARATRAMWAAGRLDSVGQPFTAKRAAERRAADA